MTSLIARLFMVFAFLAATVHAPALAHAGPSDHHDSMVWNAGDDHHDTSDQSPDAAGEEFHHHHCPATDVPQGRDLAGSMPVTQLPLFPYRAAPLTSLSQAPPTQPPSA